MAESKSKSWLRALISKVVRVGTEEQINRRALRFIAGTGITLTAQDSALNDETRVTIAAAVADASVAFLPYITERALYSGQRKTGLNTNIGGNASAIVVSPDRTKIFIFASYSPGYTDRVSQWTMSTPGDLSTATYDGYLTMTAQDNLMQSVSFNAAGTRMYAVGRQNDAVYQYNLSTAWDIVASAPTYAGSESIVAQTTSVQAAHLSPDGVSLIVSSGATAYQYTLNTPGELLDGITYDGVSVSMSAAWQFQWGLGRNGTPGGRLFFANVSGVTSFICPTPYRIAGSSLDPTLTFNPVELSGVYGAAFIDGGLRLWMTDTGGNIYEYYTFAAVPAA